MVRRVAVVGAGSSGLVCVKCCLEEGLEPVCFESSNDIGGLWRFRENPEPGRSSTYRSLVVNTSKEMMCFSDFPMPAHFPSYMHNSQLLQYLRLYATHFDLLRHIRFQTTVLSVKQRPDFSSSGQWEVVTESRDGHREQQIFDAVLVCSGQYTSPVTPLKDFPGFETFRGQYCHSWEYKDPDPYQGKKVVVVGIGNSGGDIAVEISRAAKQTLLSTRQGTWVMGRTSSRGLPVDMSVITRPVALLTAVLPRRLLSWAIERSLNQKYDHQLYGLMPRHRIMDYRPLINDELPVRILTGLLVMKPNIQEFRGSTVVFEDGTTEAQVDAVVFCTGYNYSFPFLPSSIFPGPGHELTLYKHVFPPWIECPTLAVLGVFQVIGSIMPAVEMQARWVTRVITGFIQLPPKEKMLKDIEKERKRYIKGHPCPKVASLQLDYIPYLDDLAGQFGVRPKLLRLLLRDPHLGLSVLLGPCTPYQYRLYGPGQWAGARQAILTQWERVAQPMKTRAVPEPPSSRLPLLLALSGAALVVAAVCARNNLQDLLASPSN
uniref:Flavin-containing monooxygenase n=1 Tax=Paramormyrops kingsleyae TaxID=1676925 RepID=A0A3B3S934_9TELE|nr:dimethylaniline monooxygenase [N-oxide-forming] 5-like [Paramormyrops kingsleyae]